MNSTTQATTQARKEIKLESPLLALVDGASIGINADVIELIRSFQRKIIDILLGDKQPDGSRRGRYEFEGKKYSAQALRKKEELLGSSQSLQQALAQAKKNFIDISDEFKAVARGSKPTMAILIEESCTKRNRMNSILIIWAKTKEVDENSIFDKHVNTFKDFEAFCVDLLNFLGDLVRSCPKAQEQSRQRFGKWSKIKELIPFVIPDATKENLDARFLKYVKINHLDKLSLADITDKKVIELFTQFQNK